MKIEPGRCEGILILSLQGRLDARAATDLEEQLRVHTLGTDRTLVLDMEGVVYLSSAGIRAILAAEKGMRGRNGCIHLSSLQPYPRSVLEMTGFLTLLSVHTSRDEAVRAARATLTPDDAGSRGAVLAPFTTRGAEYRATRTGSGTTSLGITGYPRDRALQGPDDGMALPATVSTAACSLGQGAPGRPDEQSAGATGDLLTIGNIVVWLPPESGDAPEYLVLDPKMTEIPLTSPFLIASSGSPQILVQMRAGSTEGVMLSEIFDALARIAVEAGSGYRGVLALSFAALSPEVRIHAPSPGDPDTGNSGGTCEQVLGPPSTATLAGCAIAVDPGVQPSHFRGAVADALVHRFPHYPGSVPRAMGLVFRDLPLDDERSPAQVLEQGLNAANPVTLCHLSTRTMIRRATIRVSVISDILLLRGPEVIVRGDVAGWNPDYERIVKLVHHDCAEVRLHPISGGFSGSLVFRDEAYDRNGRREMPFVLKLDTWSSIRAEIDGYEGHVKRYIQNNATQIIQHERSGDYGGILYTFVGIQGPQSRIFSLEEFYLTHSTGEVLEVFDLLFRKVLRAWYGQPRIRDMPLYQVYADIFMYEGVKEWAERRYGISAGDEYIELPHAMGRSVNPLYFMESILPKRISEIWSVYEGSVHGDLNMKNVLMDDERNIWLIDFAMTGHSHILRDIAKLEAVLKFEMIPVASDDQVRLLLDLERVFLRPGKLGEIPEIPDRIRDPAIEKAFRVVTQLRRYADTVTLLDEDIRQYYLALLSYTLCVPAFVSVNDAMKEYAWISSSILCTALNQSVKEGGHDLPVSS